MKQKRPFLLLFVMSFLMSCLFTEVRAQSFEQYFEDNTLRLDYVFAGNSSEQHI